MSGCYFFRYFTVYLAALLFDTHMFITFISSLQVAFYYYCRYSLSLFILLSSLDFIFLLVWLSHHFYFLPLLSLFFSSSFFYMY